LALAADMVMSEHRPTASPAKPQAALGRTSLSAMSRPTAARVHLRPCSVIDAASPGAKSQTVWGGSVMFA